jgi:uncharacterized protein YfdQ (DUF2303 family)
MDIFTSIVDAIKKSAKNEVDPIEFEGETLALIPDGYTLESFKGHSDRIRRPDESVKIFREESFRNYWGRFSNDNSVCFGDLDGLTLSAVIDYHSADGTPAHCKHSSSFTPRLDIGWKFWKGCSGKFMSQRDFQRVLEERTDDIIDPEGAGLLDLIANLEATMRIEAGDVHRLDNGSRNIQYRKANQFAGDVTIPARIRIATGVFEGAPVQEVPVLLRWDVDDETHKAKFALEIPDIKGVEQAAFTNLAKETEKLIGDRFFWAAK